MGWLNGNKIKLETFLFQKNKNKTNNFFFLKEWNGDFSDDSPKWTESLKKAVGFQKVNDGTFWMSFEDFIKYYNDIIILYYKDDWVQSFNKVKVPAEKSPSFPFTVKKQTKARICFNQVRNTDLIHLRLHVKNSKGEIIGTSGKVRKKQKNQFLFKP